MTFINGIRVPAERSEEFVRKWDRGADYVRSQPGLIWTSLHRALDPAGPFQYFTIASWESTAAFRAAISTDWWREYVADFGLSAEPTGFSVSPALCEIVRGAALFGKAQHDA